MNCGPKFFVLSFDYMIYDASCISERTCYYTLVLLMNVFWSQMILKWGCLYLQRMKGMNEYTLVLTINILSMMASYDFEMGLREGMGGHCHLARPYLGPRIILYSDRGLRNCGMCSDRMFLFSPLCIYCN